ncbi:MAG TPA: efflux RND transporter permease subunit, partial [Candidatus Bathyarchaeia archaeon]|nr:efflux RND transporter permease subunit [Candidatus Bathyarchaeia archaeon]
LNSDEFPVFEISLGGNIPEAQLREHAENLEDILLDVSGVASITRYGWRDPEFWVEVDPEKLAEFHVSMEEMMRALASRNITLPGGLIRTKELEYSIRTTGEFDTAPEIEEVVIRANDAGNSIRVKDVAKVRASFEDASTIVETNGNPTLTMIVVKTGEADIIHLVDRVKKALAQFQQGLSDDVEITITNDMSYYVKRRLNVLTSNGMIGLFLVILVLFVFLDPIPALTTAFGIPFALFATFGIMSLFGISVNLISMLGLIIVLGMLVDDGIVVSENVYRYVEQGLSPKEAAIRGTNEVIAPVLGTILTTVAAFAPLLFMTDIMGKFIRQIPIAVIIALCASLLESFVTLPSHLSDLIHIHHKTARQKKKGPHQWFIRFQDFYARMLNTCLEHRYKFLMLFLIGAGVIFVVASQTMRYIGFKDDGIEQFFIKAEAPEGTSLYRTKELAEGLDQVVASLPKEDLDAYRTYVGAIEEDAMFDPNAKAASNLVTVTVFLTPAQGRVHGVREIAADIREKVKGVQGFDKISVDLPQAGPPTGKAIEVGVKGENFERLMEIAGQVLDFLKTVPGVSDLNTTYHAGKKQLRVIVDQDKAKQYNLDVQRIASAVRYAFDGGLATTVKRKKADKEIDVLVRFEEDKRRDIGAFENILIENGSGNLVPLRSVARVEEVTGLYSIQHL